MSGTAMVIAVDGPAAAGKGTLARRLAQHFGFDYLDTGQLYRAVARKLLAAGGDAADPSAATAAAVDLSDTDLRREDLRTEAVGQAASKVAAIPGVRAALLDFQRAFAAHPPGGAGAVLDGRDIGTVVCPEADAKLFITASLDVRTDRRVKELQDRGLNAIREVVLRDMRDRDARDSARAIAPLEPANDALVIDTSGLAPDVVLAQALEYIQRTRAND